MTHIAKSTEVAAAGREKLVQTILSSLERTFPGGEQRDAVAYMAEFFRGLETQTLRSIAYQQGAFEPDLEYERAEERE